MLAYSPQSFVSVTLSFTVCLDTHEIPHSYSCFCFKCDICIYVCILPLNIYIYKSWKLYIIFWIGLTNCGTGWYLSMPFGVYAGIIFSANEPYVGRAWGDCWNFRELVFSRTCRVKDPTLPQETRCQNMSEDLGVIFQDGMHKFHRDFPENTSVSMAAAWLRFKTKTLESLRKTFFPSRMLFGILLSFWSFPCGEFFRELFPFEVFSLNDFYWKIYILYIYIYTVYIYIKTEVEGDDLKVLNSAKY